MKAVIGQNLIEASEILISGGLVAVPTETVYGLAANALDPLAVVKIFEVKNRPFFDPLIVHCRNSEEAFRYAENISSLALKLARAFWPGPLTLVLKKRDQIPDIVTSGSQFVALRVPNHKLLNHLLELLPFPLAAPSANPFGYISPTTAEHVNDQLGDQIPYILDGGPCKIGLESTIVSFKQDIPQVLRLGGIPIEALEAFLGPVEIIGKSISEPEMPGQLDSHYSPGKPLILSEDLEMDIEKFGNKKIAVLIFNNVDFSQNIYKTYFLSKKGDMPEAASNLFSALRELDQSDAEIILTKLVPDYGLGKAINDRLKRAAWKN